MKITKVDIYMLDATAQRASRRPICCRVWTDEGFYGDGEAGIAFDYAAPAGIGMLQDISRLVIGKDPMRTDELWERMFKVSFWGQGGGPVVFAAISAIDIALMDIKGKVLNVPVYELLGGKVNDSIRCYASQLQFGWNEDVGPRGTAKEYADICKYAMEDGYDAVKLDLLFMTGIRKIFQTVTVKVLSLLIFIIWWKNVLLRSAKPAAMLILSWKIMGVPMLLPVLN